MPGWILSKTSLRGVGMSGSLAACTRTAVMQQNKQMRMSGFIVSDSVKLPSYLAKTCPYALTWNQRGRLVHLHSDNEPTALESLSLNAQRSRELAALALFRLRSNGQSNIVQEFLPPCFSKLLIISLC